jgi:starch synthase
LRVAFVTAEAIPYAKVGGLADVAGTLPRELAALGAQITVLVPGYRAIDRTRHGLRAVPLSGAPTVPVGARREPWHLETARLPGTDVEVLFVGGRYFDRDGIYTDPRTGRDFEDQAERWVFFCRAAMAALEREGQAFDIVHLNDHHTALLAAYLRQPEAAPSWDAAATFFSIHNLGYQGLFRAQLFPLTGLPPAALQPMGPLEFWGAMNLMKAGLVLADRIGTVSPTYAREIQESDEYGHGLQGVLRARQHDLVGILNGIDTGRWNPAADPFIAAPFDREDLGGKEACKRALLERLGLRYNARAPVMGCIGRMTAQKGHDLLLEALPSLLALGVQLVVLGAGAREIEAGFLEFARRRPDQLAVRLDFDDGLAHAIEAGCDFFLMPSRYEPCGLNQMYSLRYGTVPIVRRTGGLADTVRDWDPASARGTGFLFGPYEVEALLGAVRRALAAYADPAALLALRRAGMAEDFSWRRSAERYLEAYGAAIQHRRAVRGGAAAGSRDRGGH